MQSGPRLLFLCRGEDPDFRPSFASGLEAQGWAVESMLVSDRARARGILDVILSDRTFSSYDVVAVSEYFLTWAVCVRLLLRRSKPKVVALSFNQSSRRLARTGFWPVDLLLNRVWRRISLFVVHSRAEARLFATMHDIPPDRFLFSHWGYDLPRYEPRTSVLPHEAYVTMVGRNNRDLSTFCRAVELAGVRGVLITADYMLGRGLDERCDNVDILVDRPVAECLNYVAGSFAHLVLVSDSERGAGHISAVSAMLLAKPQIFSDVPPLADYLVDDFNGIAVPVGDAKAVAEAIRRLRSEPELAKRLGLAGRDFARRNMSDEASARRMADALRASIETASACHAAKS